MGDYTYSDRTDTAPFRMMLHAFQLRIPMKHETIDVSSPDPFVIEVDSRWESVTTFSTYDSFVDSSLEQAVSN